MNPLLHVRLCIADHDCQALPAQHVLVIPRVAAGDGVVVGEAHLSAQVSADQHSSSAVCSVSKGMRQDKSQICKAARHALLL